MVQSNERPIRLYVSTPKEYIATLPQYKFEGRIIVVQGDYETQRAVQALSGVPVVGFDTETRPTFHKGPMRPPALIQISTQQFCFLFRIHRGRVPQALADFLASPDTIKVGISLKDDSAALTRTQREVSTNSWVDLQHTAKQLGLSDQGLARLFANVFGMRISKSQQRSNWEADVLSPAQKTYAATDADACLKLYEALLPLTQGKPYQLEEFPQSSAD